MANNVGFTGSRKGMTPHQRDMFITVLKGLRPQRVIHGDCVGADQDFHNIVREYIEAAQITLFPAAVPPHLRAFCDGDDIREPLPPLDRNKLIVTCSDFMMAAPGESYEVQRSGTWSTIRYCKKIEKPLLIIYPNGTTEMF